MKGGFSRKSKKKLGGALSGGLLGQLLGESGNTISNADRARLQAMMGSAGAGAGAAAALGGSGNSISNANMARIQKLLGSMKSPQPKTDRQLMQFEDGGKVKKPKTLPKPKPKIGDRNEMGPIYTDTKTGKKVKRLNKGGAAFPDLTGDGKVTQKDILKGRGVTGFRKGGKAIKESKFGKMGEALMGGLAKSLRKKTGNSISNADKAAVRKLVQETGNKTDRQIMQFEHGGEVRGMGRAYMGSPKKAKIR